MNPPELIQSSTPHFVAVDEGSRDAKGRKSYVVDDDRQPAVNSDEMADAMDAANRKKVAFSDHEAPQAGTKKLISPDVEVKNSDVSESADQDRSASQPTPPKFKVALPLSIQTSPQEISTNAALGAVLKTTLPRDPEPQNSDEMAHAMDAVNRKKVSFSDDAEQRAGTRKSINLDVEATNSSASHSADQDRTASPAPLPKFQDAQPLPIQTQTEEIIADVALRTSSRLAYPKHPKPDQDIAARLDTLKAQNNAVRTSLDAFDSQSLARA
jgi:hypothetical protein